MTTFKNRHFLISNTLIIIIILVSFWNINKIFFQQDEWLGVGGAMYRHDTFGTIGTIAQVFNFQNKNESTRFLPVTSISNSLLYNGLRLNFTAYGILALIVITISAILLNLIVYKITDSYLLSTLTALMWVTNNLAYQAFTWIGTMVPSLFTLLFFLLGLYFLLLFNGKKKNYFLILSILSVILSLFAKETSIFYLVPYLTVIWLFFDKKFGFFSKIKISALFFIPLIISIFLPRLIFLFNRQSDFAPSADTTSRLDIVYNFFLIPAKSLCNVFFSSSQIHELVYSANRKLFDNQIDGFVISRIVGDAVSLLIAFFILLLILLVSMQANKESKKLIFFSLISFFASTIPFIMFKSTDVIMEPRFYIFPAIFSSLLVVTVINSLTFRLKNIGKILIVLIFIPILLFYIGGVRKMLNEDIKTGDHRKGILETVSMMKPILGKDNIFYIFTEHTGFYEFQSGFGQTLAVYFYDTGKIPKEALIDRDFWDLSFEGVKTFDNKKYGYYMTYAKLLGMLQENKDISLDDVHSFYWEYQNHKVRDVSLEIKEKLTKDLKNENSL